MSLGVIRYSALVTFALSAALSGCSGSTTQPVVPLNLSAIRPATGLNCPAYSGGSGILVDGDFSLASDPGDKYIAYTKGQTFAPEWVMAGAHNLNFVGSTYWNVDSLCSANLDGALGTGAAIHQGFVTVRNTVYTVTFLLSGDGSCAPTTKTVVVKAENQSKTFTWNTASGNDAQDGNYTAETWSFTANALMAHLEFKSLDPKHSQCGAVIAGVGVTAS